MTIQVRILRGLIHAYRICIAPILKPSCRYEPTCSQYALDALKIHGALRGTMLAVKRIFSCAPWGGSGWDPVPNREDQKNNIS